MVYAVPGGFRRATKLSRLSLTSSHDDKGDQRNHDSDATDDVRHPGDQTGNVAGVGQDEAEIVPRTSTATIAASQYRSCRLMMRPRPTLMGAFRQSKRQSLL
jgi:hypothetical protein